MASVASPVTDHVNIYLDLCLALSSMMRMLSKWESLNSLDLRNGGVALYLENFNRLNCTLVVLFPGFVATLLRYQFETFETNETFGTK